MIVNYKQYIGYFKHAAKLINRMALTRVLQESKE